MSEIAYACPSCRANVSVPRRAAGKTLPCPHCGKKCIVPAPALPDPSGNFSFSREDDSSSASVRTRDRRASRRLNGARIVLWMVFLMIVLGTEAVRLATAYLQIQQGGFTNPTPEARIASAVGWTTLFFVFFALDRIISPNGE